MPPRHGPGHGDGSATPPTPPQSSNHPDFFRDDANSNSYTPNNSNHNSNPIQALIEDDILLIGITPILMSIDEEIITIW